MRQIHKLTHHLRCVDKLTVEDAQSGPLKKFLIVSDGVVSLNTSGETFLTILVNHTELLEKTFELNILRAMNRGISYLKTLQAQNSFFLVELAQDAMHEVVCEIRAPNEPISPFAQEEHDLFMQRLQDIVLRVFFPKEGQDIEIPISLEGHLNSKVFLKIQKEALPRKMAKMYVKATSEVTKYKFLAKAVLGIKNILSKAPELGPAKVVPHVTYPQQDAFNQQLLDVMSVFFDHVNSKFFNLLKPSIQKRVIKQGPKIVDKLAAVDINSLLNKGLKGLCRKINTSGFWEEIDGKDVFHFVATAPKTRAQKIAQARITHRENQEFIDETVSTMAHNLEGLISLLSAGKAKIQKVEPTEPQTRTQSLLSRIMNVIHAVFMQIKKSAVRFLFRVFGIDKRITKLSQKVVLFAEQLDLQRVARPVKRLVIQKNQPTKNQPTSI